MSPLWRKLAGDVRAERGRLVLTLTALALSIAGLGAMLDVYAVLTREVTRNYRETMPAAATIEVDSVDAATADEVRRFPGIAAAERRRAVNARARDGADWRPLRLFVVDDFDHMRLNTFIPQDGAAWPPPPGTLLLERTAVRLMGVKMDGSLTVRSPHGTPQEMRIAGLVHDAGLAPSEQERTIYAYTTEQTLRLMGESGGFDELRLRLSDEHATRSEIIALCRDIAVWLEARGHHVHEMRIPPPRRHPHQGPMEAVLLSFVGFGAMALLLSAVLMATTMTALLAKQIRQIAMLKAIGGSRGQIAVIYGALAAAIGGIAVLVAVPAGLAVARPFALQIATLINFTIVSHTVPLPVLLAQVGAGIALPLLAAGWPICRAVNLPVRAGLADHGAPEASANPRRARPASRWALFLPQWTLAWRNASRRRARFMLTLALLGASCAILMSAFNLQTAWAEIIGRVYTERSYDVSVQLRSMAPTDVLQAAMQDVDAVGRAEAWLSQPTAFHTPGEVPVTSTYPDGGHGAFTLYGVPPASRMVAFPRLAGRWLRPGDTDSVVLNHAARSARRGVRVGDRVSLNAEGDIREWTVVGFVEEVGSAAAAYVPREELTGAGTAGRANLLRIALSPSFASDKPAAIRRIEQALESRRITVSLSFPLAELRTAMGAHILVLIRTLLAAALVMGTVAGLGLSAMLSMGVIERTREFGVLRAVGATPGDIARLVMLEAVAMGSLGLAVAVPLSLGISSLLGWIVGRTAFQIPLPLSFSEGGLIICLGGLVLLIGAAAGLPARAAARITVRTALDFN
ncbi:MAG: ABC transporter permease [Opitutae bacterium]|nr:ABC transporter permease [Opitutae bacterium]